MRFSVQPSPPLTLLLEPRAEFWDPPLTLLTPPLALLLAPPLTLLNLPLAEFWSPPLALLYPPLAVFPNPPLTLEKALFTTLCCPTTSAPKLEKLLLSPPTMLWEPLLWLIAQTLAAPSQAAWSANCPSEHTERPGFLGAL